jgi:hypothetical protein
MNKLQVHRDLLYALIKVRNGATTGTLPHPSLGICANVNHWLCYKYDLIVRRRQCKVLMRDAFKRWPEYSGNILYPIRSENALSEQAMYDAANADGTMWDVTTPYGAARIDLLDWLIEDLEDFLYEHRHDY